MAKFPLMRSNILREDLDAVIAHLQGDDPILTNGPNCAAFEARVVAVAGLKHSVFVNAGASANLLSMAVLKIRHPEGGEVIVPTLTWVSDIATVLQNGFTPVFVDIDPRTLAMDPQQVIDKITDRTRAVFLTHVQGFDGLDDAMMAELEQRNIPLIEDVCESHGATHGGQRLGSFGWMSNFSFYYAHHMSTIEGGMVCTERRPPLPAAAHAARPRHGAREHRCQRTDVLARASTPTSTPTSSSRSRPTTSGTPRSAGSWAAASSSASTPTSQAHART